MAAETPADTIRPKLSAAQLDVLKAAAEDRVQRSLYSPTRWYTMRPSSLRTVSVTTTVNSLMKRGLLETGQFVALGVPRLAVVTDAGRTYLGEVSGA